MKEANLTHGESSGATPFAILGTAFQRVTNHPAFNRLSGVIPAAYFFLMVMAEAQDLVQLAREAGNMNAEWLANSASSAAKILFLSLIVVLFLVRKPPISKASGLQPRVVALAGAFLLVAIVLLPPPEPSLGQSLTGLALVAIGSVFSVIAIGYLGRSFSIMAEARELVTHGVYSLVRHPLYLAEEIAVLGVVVIYFSLPALALLFLHIALQIQRMKNEEGILREAFPAYGAYMTRTSRLIPGIY